MASNKAAWLRKAGSSLEIDDAPMPIPGPNEIIIQNSAIAINPLDTHMHAINLVTGKPQDGAFALYTAVPATKAAILPDMIPFTQGVVTAFTIEAAVCALSVKQPGVAMPGVSTPALALAYPSLQSASTRKTLIIYGGSSSVGSMTTQLATAAGIKVILIASKRNFDLCRSCRAAAVFDYHEPSFVQGVIAAALEPGRELVGIFDAISTPETYKNDLAILGKTAGVHLACVHPPPENVLENIKAGMIFAVNDVATPVWEDFVAPLCKPANSNAFHLLPLSERAWSILIRHSRDAKPGSAGQS